MTKRCLFCGQSKLGQAGRGSWQYFESRSCESQTRSNGWRALANALLEWSGQTPYRRPEDWVFASPKMNGKQPYWPETMLKCYVQPIAKHLGITKKIGWHTFRRSFATLLSGSNENTKTTQELRRHANAGITMNLYTQALTPAKRAAHLKVVEMIRPVAGTASVPLCSHAQEAESVSA